MQHSLLNLWQNVPEIIRNIIYAVLVFFIFWLIALFITSLIRKVLYSRQPKATNLITKTTRNIILVIGLIAALGAAGVNISALIASAGLLGFAIGFALKDLLSNVISGMLLLFNKAIEKGDHIMVSGCEGTVEKIELRYTTLKAEDKIYLIPNSTLFSNILTIFKK